VIQRVVAWLARWRSGGTRAETELDREIRIHLELEAEEQRDAGLRPEEARTAALRAFGNPTAVKETARDLRRRLWLDHVLQDVRFASRQMLRAPGFAAAAALTLALGIGANTAVFSVINGYTRPLPVPDPDRIVVIASTRPDDETGIRFKFSFPAIRDYRAQATVFSDVFGFDLRLDGVSVDGKTSPFLHEAVTGNFFSALGLTPAVGRFFHPGEGETPNADRLVVISYAFWQRRLAADPNVVGTTVRLDGQPTRIIGVAPEGFHGLMEGAEADGYTPIGMEGPYAERPGQFITGRAIRGLTMVARLKPGVTLAQAQADVDVIARTLAERYPDTEKNTTARVLPEQLARPMPIPFLTTLLPLIQTLLQILVAMVLLIACMNVANLLLVRASVRQAEMAVRAALGAGRRRLVRLMLAESCSLAALGAGLGLLLGKLVSVAFASSIDIGTDLFRVHFEFDWRVFTFTLATGLATGVIVGVLPALRASRAEVTDLLHDGGRGGSAGAGRQRVRSILVVSQVAGSVALLVVAGLVVRSLREAQRVDLGFDPDHVVTLRLDTSHAGFDRAQSRVFYDELLRRIQGWPGVESASLSFSLPLGYLVGGAAAHPEGETGLRREATSVGYNTVTRDYFRTLRIPILRGRGFTDQDVEGAERVAIVNETLAARFWPNQDPIGKRIDIPNAPGEPWEVVGVARDGKYIAVFEWPLPHFYVPMAQDPPELRALAVRSTLPFTDLSLRLQREIEALAPDLPIADLRPLRDVVRNNFGFVLFRVGVWQATAMGLIGLILAVVGVYGVVSYRTTQRSREIGIRMALGAVPADVRRLVLRQGASLVAGGIAAGLIVTLAFAGTLRRVLVSVSSLDPLTFGVVTVFVSLTALAACYIPARRAMRMDPASVLRRE
jgi:predicted permease